MSSGWRWHRARLVSGHGVASGRNPASPYPAGTIALQAPLFRRHGLDLSAFFAGTLNLAFSPGEWRLQQPDWQVSELRWSDCHPPETFSFWRCRLRLASPPEEVEALIYYPHPHTKRAHHQPAGLLEVLAPWLAPLAEADPAARQSLPIDLGVDPRRARLVQPARLRARLLEFLKFRVLAAQESFFAPPEPGPSPQQAELRRFRHWLAEAWPEALDLSDADLQRCLDDARRLYVN